MLGERVHRRSTKDKHFSSFTLQIQHESVNHHQSSAAAGVLQIGINDSNLICGS